MIIKKYCIPFIYSFAVFITVLNSRHVMVYVKNALAICYNNVIPSLFVFMVLSSFLGQGNFTYFLSVPFNWYCRLLKINDREFSSALLLSFIGGFAVGANFIDNMQKRGYEKNCIQTISPAMINNSFSFSVLAVGIGMLDNVYLGYMLFTSLTVSSLITSFLLSFIYKYNNVTKSSFYALPRKSFVECVNSSVSSILSICGYVVIFYVLCKVFSLYIPSKTASNILSAALEVTCGCSEISLNSGKNPFLICVVLSIIPVSTLCQVFHFTQNKNIIKTLIFSRLIHTPSSLLIFTVLCNLFPVNALVIKPETVNINRFYNSAEISTVLFMLIFSFILVIDRNKLFTKTEK